MGCDIHAYLERKYRGRWVMVRELGHPSPFAQRNYGLFNILAGVRGPGPATPLGIPDDASDGFRMEVDDWDCDGHSHSYIDIVEAKNMWLLANTGEPHFTDNPPNDLYWRLFEVDKEYIEGTDGYEKREYRIVFFFDN